MISGFDFYRAYLAIKLHFNTPYDVIKYCGKTKATQSDFVARNDKFIFEKWAKACPKASDAIDVCVANSMGNVKTWAHQDIDTGMVLHTAWVAKKAAITHHISKDIYFISSYVGSKIPAYSDAIEKTKSGNKAPLLQLYLSGKILPDTIVALDKFSPFLEKWKGDYSNDPLVTAEVFKLVKYRPFSKPNLEKLRPTYDVLESISE